MFKETKTEDVSTGCKRTVLRREGSCEMVQCWMVLLGGAGGMGRG